MIYVSSDWHGCPPETIRRLLQTVEFGEHDFLYVLGDVIDRGPDGIALLLWLMEQPNMQLILGNHEKMLLDCGWLFDEITDNSLAALVEDKLDQFSNWLFNGAEPTIEALQNIDKKTGVIADILDYLRDAPLYELVTVQDKDFLLTHAGLGHYAPGKRISAYAAEDLMWNRPSLSDVYMDAVLTIFGHTPVRFYGAQYDGQVLRTDTWIDVDTGSGHGGKPCLLRLDDLRAFYLTDD